LQVGIGALGDAVCHALRLRDKQSDDYTSLLRALGVPPASLSIGGDAPFREGLYVASELISNPLFSLFEAGIVRRRVSEDPATERARRPGHAQPIVGTSLQGAFLIGPNDFYERLRNLPPEQRALIDMTSVAEVNRVYEAYEIERLQRRHGRFLNVTMKATLLGAAVSDQLANGAVVSGVGGQNEFVMMAHQLPEARSALLFRSTYRKGKELHSNVHWEYPHCTIPRHMRDLFVTEYGVADLRGKTDQECVAAMLAISDSRFQEELCQAAKRGHKLPKDYVLPGAVRNNTPERLEQALSAAQAKGLLPRLPFGCDLTEQELRLAARLKSLSASIASWEGRGKLLSAASKQLTAAHEQNEEDLRFALAHLELDRPSGPKERLFAQLVRASYAL
jgi:acyl-CoA hydrolase